MVNETKIKNIPSEANIALIGELEYDPVDEVVGLRSSNAQMTS